MSLNAAEINLVLKELDLKNFYIQKIVQPDFHTLIFSIYSPWDRYNLLISMKPGTTRIHSYGGCIRKVEKLQRFSQFLRSRIMGAKIYEVSQPGNDRIVKMELKKGDEITILWIRLWGGNSNIIATDENNVILDSYYRRPGKNEVSGATLYYQTKEKDPSKFPVREYPQGTSFNQYVDKYYFALENAELRVQLHLQIKAFINRITSRLEARLSNIKEQIKSSDQFEKYKQYGELIVSGIREIHRGDTFFQTSNYYGENETIRIPLDPKLSPSENSEKYFHRYKKAKNGLQLLSQECHNLEIRLDALYSQDKMLEAEQDIYILQDWLDKEKRQESKIVVRDIPGVQFNSGSFILYVGRTAKENDELLRRHVRGNDYWLHTRDYAGGYVFIKVEKGKSIPLETLLDAGNLAVHFSKGKNAPRADVYYTQVKYLRRAKDGPTGLVLPTQEKNLSITKDESRLKRLLGDEQ